jgi:prepilin-type N-terminal cleavage/methylation domain-containing protein
MKNTNKAFTLIELVIVVTVLTILASIAVPEVLQARNKTRAANAGSACRAIEAAKDMWRKDYPGVPIPDINSLKIYFPNNSFPKDPWNIPGTGFLHVTDLTKPTEHIYNNNPKFEPAGNCAPDNGYNDSYQPRRTN